MNNLNNLKLAKTIADSASHFDFLCCMLPAEHKLEAAIRIEQLHDAAALLAGDDVNQVYSPDDARRYEVMTQYHNSIELGGETIALCHNRNIAGKVTAMIAIASGPFSVAVFASPHKVRQLILALRELVDECDASADQHTDPLSLPQAAGRCVACEAN